MTKKLDNLANAYRKALEGVNLKDVTRKYYGQFELGLDITATIDEDTDFTPTATNTTDIMIFAGDTAFIMDCKHKRNLIFN